MRKKPSIDQWIAEHHQKILCACGCGEYVPISRSTYYKYKNGQRKFFILTHQMRREHHGKWKGGVVQAKGYTWIRMPNHHRATPRGYVKRAHLMAEETLGRPLAAGEFVHHVNGDKKDDGRDNLQIVTRAAHASLHNTASGNPSYRRDISTDDIIALRQAGETLRSIASALGCSVATVKRRLRSSPAHR